LIIIIIIIKSFLYQSHLKLEQIPNLYPSIHQQGEDGQETQLTSLLANSQANAWSYKSALKILQNNDSSRDSKGYHIERTDVASIIAAARKNIKEKDGLGLGLGLGQVDVNLDLDVNMEGEQDGEVKDAEASDDDGSNDDDDASASENDNDNGSTTSSNSNGKDKNGDSDNDSGDESSDDEVDDVEKAKDMDQDVVRDRKAKTKKRSNDNNDFHQDNDNSDDDDDDDSVDEDDEDAKREAAKAAKYFDSALLQGNQVSEFEKMDVFAQLNLSRPLLRGVASIGFVTPTPIQSRVIPLALSGRDVCAR